MTSRGTQRRGWALRLFVAAAFCLIGSWSWQLGLVEVFEHHDELAESCPDDDHKGPCDCGDNCHCCFLCAHQIAPVVAPVPVEVPAVFLAMTELPPFTDHGDPASVEQPRVPKVPKRLV